MGIAVLKWYDGFQVVSDQGLMNKQEHARSQNVKFIQQQFVFSNLISTGSWLTDVHFIDFLVYAVLYRDFFKFKVYAYVTFRCAKLPKLW